MEQDMKLFYDIAYTAIKQEDINLRKLFNHSENNKKLYNDEHNGICCLYETTFVYLIFKALMENKQPFFTCITEALGRFFINFSLSNVLNVTRYSCLLVSIL